VEERRGSGAPAGVVTAAGGVDGTTPHLAWPFASGVGVLSRCAIQREARP